jgi:hypothetical protein
MRRSDYEMQGDSAVTGDVARKKKSSRSKEASKSSPNVPEGGKGPEAVKPRPRPRPKPALQRIAGDGEEDYDGTHRRAEPGPSSSTEKRKNPEPQIEEDDVGEAAAAPLPPQPSIPQARLGEKRPNEDEAAGGQVKKKVRVEKVVEGQGKIGAEGSEEQAKATKAKTRMGKQQEMEKNKRSLRSRTVK